MSSPKEETFNMHPVKVQPSKEQLTPHKFALLVLIWEEFSLHRTERFTDIALDDDYPWLPFTEREKRQIMTTLLDLLQSPDMPVMELKSRLVATLTPNLMNKFNIRLDSFDIKGFVGVVVFMEGLGSIMSSSEHNDPTTAYIDRTSVAGLFIRRMWLAYSQMSFSQLCNFQARLRSYLTGKPITTYSDVIAASCRGEDVPVTRDGFSFSDSCGLGSTSQLSSSDLLPSDLNTTTPTGEVEKVSFSQKQAEFFISQQTSLLSMDENKALSPKQLQKKLSVMLEQHPDIAEAHFLSYLNNLRMREYCTAVHNLYHYFDRTTQLTGELTGNAKRTEDEVSRRYAALNLAALHFNFKHEREARAALLEAIRMAQESNDHICLQHALSWLNLLKDQEGSKAGGQIERSVGKSHELNLSYLTSLGVQALARHNAFATATPSSVFDYMMKSNVINCQNSLYSMMSISGAQRAGLWSYYGNRECAAMCAQLVLCLDTEDKGVFYNGESTCVALCLLARHHADRGDHSGARETLQHARQRFPAHTRHAHLWQACEQSLAFERSLLQGQWGEAERAAHSLRAVDDCEGRLHLARLQRERGEMGASLNALQRLREEAAERKDLTPDFLCRVLLLMSEVLMVTDNHTTALPHLTHCLTHATSHHLHYLASLTTLYLAVVQLRMKLAGQALRLIETAMLGILSHGGPYDCARLLYAYARCKVASAERATPEERKAATLSAVTVMTMVVSKFQAVEAWRRVKDALYYQARLYHQLGYSVERNRCALRFKQLDQQAPTLSKTCVHAV
ncbi:anaphase-promoting complex subunit 5-like isoform X2 [Babylonia areolata]|uniref:anaphase-promoting complex subunit 5-like isoform X2 n=1 Tax=Babylonia areolata TaxID=304850 RepID=UPI003FCF6EEB